MKKTLLFLKEYGIITFGAVLAATGLYFFMIPSNLVIGSATALGMVIAELVPLPVSMITLMLNVILLILGFILIGPAFGAKTIYVSILMPLTLRVFELVAPNFQPYTGDPILETLCYIPIIAAAQAVLFSHNASSGGLDIVAKIMSKYLKMNVGTAVSISGVMVALTSVFFYDAKIVVLSVLGTYFSGVIVDKFIFGLNIKRRVCIISPKLDEIVNFILHELHSGATLYDGIGAYDGTAHREVVTIVDKHEYRRLMDYVKKIDSKAFVTVYSVNEVRYQPKTISKGK